MASTRLLRKAKRNKAVARKRKQDIKMLSSKPVIRRVDIEALKAEFATKSKKPAAKKEEKVEAKVEVVEQKSAAVEEKVEKAPEAKVEVKEEKTTKKPAAKKTAPKKSDKE